MIEQNKIYNEPCLETLNRMPDNFIDSVVTSPPYWQLRNYGYDGQWGLEPTFQEYLEHLWEMMDEVYRVLKPEGTCWINLGDTYNTISGGIRGLERAKKTGSNRSISKKNIIGQGFQQQKDTNIPNKCLLLIPHRFAIGCIDRGWIVRNDIIWAKRNGMPESTQDRFTKKHEYFFFMVKSEKYYFDLDSIRDRILSEVTLEGKNPGDVSDFWDVPTKQNRESHYAQYSDNLIMKPILSGCPKGGIIYDPFMGSGSTAEAALRAERKFIGSEMSDEYIKIAEKRIHPLLTQYSLFQ